MRELIIRDRQTGKTTRAMLEAPRGATFVWCNAALAYPVALAKYLGREDLQIVPASRITHDWLAGRKVKIVLDPDTWRMLTREQRDVAAYSGVFRGTK